MPQEGETDAGKVLVKVDENGHVYAMDPADVTASQEKAERKVGDRVVAKYNGKDYPGLDNPH